MTLEQRIERLEKHNRGLTAALTVVAMYPAVTIAATGDTDGDFDTVTARRIWLENDAGEVLFWMAANDV